MEQTSWPAAQAINQKNYYVDFLKRDEQFLAHRTQQEENRNKMIKQAKDRDRALAHGHVNEDGDVDMDEDQEEEEDDELAEGNKTIVIHPGSQNLRIGLASDLLPKSIPMVVARRSKQSESEENDGEPTPKRRKIEGAEDSAAEIFGDQFVANYNSAANELKTRMRMNKRKVLPQSRDMVLSYNRQKSTVEIINEHNDTQRVDWTDVSHSPEYITGHAALRIPDQSNPRYKLHWPIRHGWINEKDYDSIRMLYNDIGLIIRDSVRNELKLDVVTREQWKQYNCVVVIPDYYERTYVSSLLDLAIIDIGFQKVSFIQESLAASFGAGFTTCCIVDVGAQKTSVCCVEDGMVLDNSRINMKYGGRDVTDEFVKMIIHNAFPYSDFNLKRRYDYLLAEELKKRLSSVDEADIVVTAPGYFFLSTPTQDTQKFSFKMYDEVALPTLALFKPDLFNNDGKLEGRRSLVSRSFDLYDGKANDPTSAAQAEILRAIVPAEPMSDAFKPKANGVNGLLKEGTDSRRPSIARIQEMENGTPTPSGASSPIRKPSPQPDAGTPRPIENGTPNPEDTIMKNGDDTMMETIEQTLNTQHQDPHHLERRDDILPVYPLANAITSSINHAARGSASKTRDLYNSLLLIGGASKVKGFTTHLELTLQQALINTGYDREIVVGRPPRDLDPEMVIWKGGAVFGRMSRTNDSWITPFLYERLGDRVLASKLMWAW